MKARLLPIFLLFAVLLIATPLQVFAAETTSSPAIGIMELKNPLAGNYPIHIYIYPGLYMSENESIPEVYGCEEALQAIHDVIQDFHHIVVRFVDEYPEYYQLVLIRFANASDASAADITIKIFKRFGPESAGALGYALFGENRPLKIGLLCSSNLTYNDYYTAFFHELFHALGVDHAKQSYTDDEDWELMYPAIPLGVKTYPSTLDLYALYMVHFGSVGGGVITLPSDLRYEMVIPYAQDIQTLRKENAKLKNQLSTSAMILEKTRQERDMLRNKLAETNATLQDLREQYEAIRNILDSYIRAYNSLQQRYENLRGNCSLLLNVCNQTYHELTAKISEKHAALLNMTQRYNQCANQFNRLYEEHQKLQADYDDVSWRLNMVLAAAFAAVAAIGGVAMWISIKHDKLVKEYNELIDELEKLEGGGEE